MIYFTDPAAFSEARKLQRKKKCLMVSWWDKWDEALFMGSNVFEVEQFSINALTHLGSGCQKELWQTVKVLGSLGHNKHGKMHFSAGHKSVIHDQRAHLERQP